MVFALQDFTVQGRPSCIPQGERAAVEMGMEYFRSLSETGGFTKHQREFQKVLTEEDWGVVSNDKKILLSVQGRKQICRIENFHEEYC